MKTMNLLLLVIMTSCASYVQRMHNQISNAESNSPAKARKRTIKAAYGQKRFYDPYGGYRGIPVDKRDAKPIANPLTLGGPQVSQDTINRRRNSKRYTANDLKDNSDNSSLWNGKNSESFLFVQNNVKRKGDVVIIEVLNSLKEDITNELKRAFPDTKKKITKDSEEKKEEKPESKVAEKKPEASSNNDENKVHDKISSVVIEEINKDYLMVRGRKEVLFKERKRFVELRALVSRKNIKDNDTVSSKSLLEPKVTALRY